MDIKKIYKGMNIAPDDLDIETYLLQNPDKLFLLVTSSCLPEKKQGSYRLMLRFKGQAKLLTKDLTNVSNANECALIGIKDAVSNLTAPNYEIILLNCIGTGMHRYLKNNSGSNKQLITEIFEILDEKQCFVSEFIFKGKANEIKNIINTTYPLSKNKKNKNSLKSLNINEYTHEIIAKTKYEVYSQVAQNMSNLRFPNSGIAAVLEIKESDVPKYLKPKKNK